MKEKHLNVDWEFVAQEMEAEGQHRQAEQHYCAAGDWRAAVNLYRVADMWEESYRVRFAFYLVVIYIL